MIAGPNGAGKTTLTDRLRREGIDFGEYINPDDIAKGLSGTPVERSAKAQKIADEKREDCISAKRSFTFETVMSHPSKVEILVRAKEAGFFVQLYFIGTDDPRTNIDRVANRVAEGGHDVPSDKIVSRWHRTMGLVHEAIRSVDDAFVFDNSVAGFVAAAPRLVFRRRILQPRNLPQSEQFPPAPNWVRHYVLDPLGIKYFGPPNLSLLRSIVTTPFSSKPIEPISQSDFDFGPSPYDLHLEQSLLGAILADNTKYDLISGLLAPKHFFEPIHQRIFANIGSLIQTEKVANLSNVRALLPSDIFIEGVQTNDYLHSLIAAAQPNQDVVRSGRILVNLELRRRLIAIGEDLLKMAREASVDIRPASLVAEAQSRIDELLAPSTQHRAGPARFEQALVGAVDIAARAYVRDGKPIIATGLYDLDRFVFGLEQSELIIIAGRAGIGKTALAASIAYNIARSWKGEIRDDGATMTVEGGIVGFFSLELSAEQLASRIIAQQTGIPGDTIRRGNISEQDFEKIRDVSIELQNLPLYIDDAGAISISQLVLRARRLKHQRGLDVIIIDNLELLQSATQRSSRAESRDANKITSYLKAIAKELHIPVVLLSQLPPKIDTRKDKRPKLSDFREATLIERDADVVWFLYREDYYLLSDRPAEGTYEYPIWLSQIEAVHGLAELIVARNRNGPTGIINLYFDASTGRFSDLARSI
jgi:replicative DNA helicase